MVVLFLDSGVRPGGPVTDDDAARPSAVDPDDVRAV